MRKTWLIVPILIALVVAQAIAGGGSGETACQPEMSLARAQVQRAAGLGLLESLRRLIADAQASDSVCLSVAGVYRDAMIARTPQILTLADGSRTLKSNEVYVCQTLTGQRCADIYADDSLCWCEYDTATRAIRVPGTGLLSVELDPRFTARWYSVRRKKGEFAGYTPLAVRDGKLDLRTLQPRAHQVFFALVSARTAKGIVDFKLVWRTR